MNIRWILLVSLLVLSSCGSSLHASAKQSSDSTSANPQATATEAGQNPIQLASTPKTTDMTTIPLNEDELVNLAKQDLADRLKIDLAQITLLKTMEIKSPDISAGCKLKVGQIHTQGNQVYGYRIWLDVAGKEYIYHVGSTEKIILCSKITPGANNPLLMTPDNSNQDYQNQSP